MKSGIETDWREIVYRGIETEELDYKAAQDWKKLSRGGRAKFARHCMAMANTKGGYIVVGVGEDHFGKPSLYTGVTERQARSFDPTAVGNFINRFADPAIDFDIERPVIDGKQYVIFVIRRFAMLPHVCAYNCDCELLQGVFYIRTAEAASRPAYRSSEIHGIVQRALRNQREFLGRMLRGILYEGREYIESDAKSLFVEQYQNSRRTFDKLKNGMEMESCLLCELSVFPDSFDLDRFSLSEIKYAIEQSTVSFDANPLVTIADIDVSYFTNVAFRTFLQDKAQFWQAFQSGLFHYISTIQKDDGNVSYLTITRFVAEALHFIGQFYSELGLDNELLSIRFNISRTEDVRLQFQGDHPIKKNNNDYICRIPEIRTTFERSVADLVSGTAEHSTRIIRKICERFNFPEGQHHILEQTVENFLAKKGLADSNLKLNL